MPPIFRTSLVFWILILIYSVSVRSTIWYLDLIAFINPAFSCLSRAPQIFSSPATRSNRSRLTYDQYVPAHQNEHFNHYWSQVAPVETEPQVTVPDFIARCLNVRRCQYMLQQGDMMTYWDEVGREREMFCLLGVKPGTAGAVEAHFNSMAPALRHILFSQVVRNMMNMKDSWHWYSLECVNKASFLLVHVQNLLHGRYQQIVFGSCIFMIIGVRIPTELPRCMTLRLKTIFAKGHNFDLFAILLRRHDTDFVKIPDRWRDQEPSRLVLAPGPLVFACNLNIILTSSASDCNHTSELWPASCSIFPVFRSPASLGITYCPPNLPSKGFFPIVMAWGGRWVISSLVISKTLVSSR